MPAGSAFVPLASMLAGHARHRPQATALVVADDLVSWELLDASMDHVAAALQRDGASPGGVAAICGGPSVRYLCAFLGALGAGLAVAPLPHTATPQQLLGMLADAGPRHVFVDGSVAAALDGAGWQPPGGTVVVRLDDGVDPGVTSWEEWLADVPREPVPVDIDPQAPFNIIYSSGTTGTPKGIVQPHAMRHAHIQRAAGNGYGPGAVSLIATPLYSNATLVSLIPALAWGSCVVICPRFDPGTYLALAERHGATHTMLVPAQYQRLMEYPDFDRHDLNRFQAKFCTSAPFPAALKEEVLRRWPGGLTEYYGLTEGGGVCILHAHLHPDKLHTVGHPAEGHDIRLIDEAGHELPREPGVVGEVVGRSPGMMTGYHGRPVETAAVEWYDAEGRRFLRTGDIGRFDEDGFLTLLDRRKDLIISGGFNVYPSDIEAVLRGHPDVADCAVFGMPSRRWGESPVACVVPRRGSNPTAKELREWVNASLGKVQRVAELRITGELPRSPIGKVLKRELRAAWGASELP